MPNASAFGLCFHSKNLRCSICPSNGFLLKIATTCIFNPIAMYTVSTFVLCMLLATLAACSCPREAFQHLGFCKYRVRCFGMISNAALGRECQGPVNIDVTVALTLENADNDSPPNLADEEFLTSITSLTIQGYWPQTNLTLLESTVMVRHLFVANMGMKQINGSPLRYLSRLEDLDLSHNQLSEIDELFTFEYNNRMKHLYLSHNKIKEISGYAFQELTSLIELDLSNNLIEDLLEEPFSNLTNLQTLNLNNNEIKYLNGAINNKQLLSLKHLYLNYNNIDKIDEKSLDKIYHLETFEISHNNLDKLSPKLLLKHWGHFNSHFICRIVYSNNNIKLVPNAIFKLMETINKHQVDVLTHLDLSNNIINRIEYNAFHSIMNMVNLDVSHNELSEFIVNSKDLANIKFLNISRNRIKNLDYQTFSLMTYLQNLDLSNNQFENAPDRSLIHSGDLKRLNITYNDIRQVEDFHVSFHTEGGILDLSQNDLSSFNLSIGEAKGLVELILQSNNITDASKIMLKHHRSLAKLDLSKNSIIRLDENSLQLPVTLVSLDLTSNKIIYMGPSAFYGVKHLRTLRLSHNKLKKIEYGVFRDLTSLLNLDLSFNHIKSLDSKVLMDLKFLRFLSVRHNNMTNLECSAWIGHNNNLIVYIDGNDLSCDWLSAMLNDYNNGYTKVHPAALVAPIGMHSLEGIPCVQKTSAINLYRTSPEYMMTDERLLAVSQKILEAVQQQTAYMRKYIWHSIRQDANKNISSNIQ